jgi:hypothetical protein
LSAITHYETEFEIMATTKPKRPRKKFTPFAVAFIEKLGRDVDFIDCRYSGIPTLIQMIDGMPWTVFKDTPKRRYFTVDQVIEWHENELKHQPNRKGSLKIIEALKNAMVKTRTEQ